MDAIVHASISSQQIGMEVAKNEEEEEEEDNDTQPCLSDLLC